MKAFISRNFITYITVSLITTLGLTLRFSMNTDEFFYSLLFIGFYVFQIVFIYAIPSSLLAEILSKKTLNIKKRLVIKAVVYFIAVLIFSIQGQDMFMFTIYAFFSALLYFILDEIIRKKK